ncbi:MAG TPA: DUF3006 family protein [Methanospirillum sp.]|nr:DUF3006 family protein [Methanospirillum sp.]
MTESEIIIGRMVVDRIEERYVILVPEDNPDEMIQFPTRYLCGVEEGDTLEMLFRKDETASREARERVFRIVERLKNQ